MRLLKEALNVDLVVDPRSLSNEEEKAINDFIKADKEKRGIKTEYRDNQN